MEPADDDPIVPVFKIGGLPAVREVLARPRCRECGREMQFIAQIPLRQPLTLARRFEMAYLFVCPGEYDSRGWLKCQTYVAGSGANAVLLRGGAAAPATAAAAATTGIWRAAFAPPADFPPHIAKARRVDEPLEQEDAERLAAARRCDIDEIIWQHVKFGGTPAWVQELEDPACPACSGSMRAIAQIPASVPVGEPFSDAEYRAMIEYVQRTGLRATPSRVRPPPLDLSFTGVGYVFLCDKECSPEGAAFLWQAD